MIPKQTGIPKPPPFGGFEKQLIDDEIVTLKSKGASKEVTYCSNEFLSNIILVTKKTGDMRPVINLKPLNVFVQKIHFKMENINTALHTIAPGDYLVSIDLKDAYFSILIFKPHRKFLRFKWSTELCKYQALSVNPDFDQKIRLSPHAMSDLRWVIENISQLNGVMFGNRPPDVYIECDASLAGWGVTCNTQSANDRWSFLESEHHINYLELLAAFHALNVFVADKFNIHIRLKMDNSAAVSYINNMGEIGSPSLDKLAVSIWGWCILRNILLSAQQIPGKSNCEAMCFKFRVVP
ncbi:uncharacterized protein [Acropora muricata]|uniref:uncharacterized protein n=1 Tax=Acropora muricata TaxID=159855 RepID=UPI0034E56B80